MSSQDKIDVEVIAVKQLIEIKEYGGVLADHRSASVHAHDWLFKRGYIYRGGRRLTDEGKEYLRWCLENSEFSQYAEKVREWKTEARTGMTDSGNETKIQNPAVPSTSKPVYNTERELLKAFRNDSDARIQIAEDLGMSLDKLLDHASDGSLRICKHGAPHFGIFHRSYKRASGWQSWCVDCRRKKRDERKERE